MSTLGKSFRSSPSPMTSLGMPSRSIVWWLATTQGMAAPNQTSPLGTSRSVPVSASISVHSARARHAIAVCHSSGPWPYRINRVSPPLD